MGVNNLTTSQNGINLIESFESFVPNAYQDSKGVWTIGYGSTYYEDGTPVGPNDPPIDQARATQILQAYVSQFENIVNQYVDVTLNQNQFDALVDFCYNCGPGNFESSTLLKDINSENVNDIATQFDRWDKAGGVVSAGLLRRRNAEIALYNS